MKWSEGTSISGTLLFTNPRTMQYTLSIKALIRQICNLPHIQTRIVSVPSNYAAVDGSRKTYSSSQRPMCFYDVLGVTPKANQSEIKSAFFRLSKIYHPDINKKDNAHEHFTSIAEAYDTLGNIHKRRLYDRGLLMPTDTYDNTSEDMDAFKKRNFRTRGPIPTGRSPIYNFDEFYKQHYGEHFKRVKMKKEKEEALKEHLKDLEYLGFQRRLHLTIWFLMVTSFFIVFYSAGEM